jgi:hypothetical protein
MEQISIVRKRSWFWPIVITVVIVALLVAGALYLLAGTAALPDNVRRDQGVSPSVSPIAAHAVAA